MWKRSSCQGTGIQRCGRNFACAKFHQSWHVFFLLAIILLPSLKIFSFTRGFFISAKGAGESKPTKDWQLLTWKALKTSPVTARTNSLQLLFNSNCFLVKLCASKGCCVGKGERFNFINPSSNLRA